MTTTIFKNEKRPLVRGIAVVFDLQGFSKFFSQPDIQDYVPEYLNLVFRNMEYVFTGGKDCFYDPEKEVHPIQPPNHFKYLGDGALYIWSGDNVDNISPLALMNRYWNCKLRFDKLVKEAEDIVPVADIPQKIRIGMAYGSMCELTKTDGSSEYCGYCINLAARLQSYCKELGFIASARLVPKKESFEKSGYIKLIAKKLRGFPQEIVIVDKSEYQELDKKIADDLFAKL